MPTEQEANILIEFMKTIPEFAWALLAVIVGAILSWVPLRCQLKHDSVEKEKERKMSLRRDVYLSVTANIGKLMEYLEHFYNMNIVMPEGFSSAIQQIDIIGSNETVAALNEFNYYMVEAFSELIPKREEISILKNRGEFLATRMKKNISEDLKKDFQSYKDIFDKKIKLTYELAEKCQQKAQLAEELLTPVIVAIRKELNTPFDEAAYLSMKEASQCRWEESTEKYIASMKGAYQVGIKPYVAEFDDLIKGDSEGVPE